MNSSSNHCDKCGAANRPQATYCIACGRPLSTSSGSLTGLLTPGSLLKQRYRLLRHVGQGGFGAVYVAEDLPLGNRLVALKEMSQTGLTTKELQEATEAFQREAQLLARLKHPNLPTIYDYFSESGRWYLSMEFINGETLESRLDKAPGGKLPVKETLQIGLQLCHVLEYLHTSNPPIIFRDLKPQNIMVSPGGGVYLIDFGIARLFKPGKSRDTMAFGSPGYAAPEQYGKMQTTAKSDIYSLGTTIHRMLSGTDPANLPFHFVPLALSTPAGLDHLILQMVEQDPEKRPATMSLVKQSLKQMIDGQSSGQVSMPNATSAPFTPPPGVPFGTSTAQPSLQPGASSSYKQYNGSSPVVNSSPNFLVQPQPAVIQHPIQPPPIKQKTSGFAIVSIILGIIGVLSAILQLGVEGGAALIPLQPISPSTFSPC